MLQKKQKVKNWFIQLQLNKQILYVEALLFMILTLAVVWLVRCVTNLNVNKCDYVYIPFLTPQINMLTKIILKNNKLLNAHESK